ncbi:MAG TPA: SDR family oxidoreductase [Gemmatimonadaceae bacterium]|nr:SDR family oxidoreductase [Gemmatimonadaceae bacterium]
MTAQPARRGTALVTGASGGIGLELARACAGDGWDVVLVARGESALRAAASELGRSGGAARYIVADLARPEAPAELVARLEADGTRVDALVNNAGFGLLGSFVTTDWAREREMIQLNVTALTELTKRLVPGMVARGRGRVLNVASTAAFVPGPFMAVYYASKAYVLSLSQALANEVRGTGVTVTALCPGPVRTRFAETAGAGGSNLFQGPLVMDAERVARAGYAAMMRGRAVVVPGLLNRILTQGTRLLPRATLAAIARRVAEEKR